MNAAVAIIQFVLSNDSSLDDDDEKVRALELWNEGEFDQLRRMYPDIPEDVFIGADPLHPYTKIEDVANQMMQDIIEQREKVLKAWIAETGLNPSEAVLMHRTRYEGGNVVNEFWVERKVDGDHTQPG